MANSHLTRFVTILGPMGERGPKGERGDKGERGEIGKIPSKL